MRTAMGRMAGPGRLPVTLAMRERREESAAGGGGVGVWRAWAGAPAAPATRGRAAGGGGVRGGLCARGRGGGGGGVDGAGEGVGGHGVRGQAVGGEAGDVIEGEDVLELDAIAEGPAGGDYGRGELNDGDVDAHVGALGRLLGLGWLRGRDGHISQCTGCEGGSFRSSRWAGRRAWVRTWPTLADGALTPSSEAKVTAMSTGATGSR